MIWEAPTRLSTTICLPSDAESLSPSRRATMSLGPPVGEGTITRMFRFGYAVWPCAVGGKAAMTNAAAAACAQSLERPDIQCCFMQFLPLTALAPPLPGSYNFTPCDQTTSSVGLLAGGP